MKLETMMSTDATTTACVVERPTPWVPPRVVMSVEAADGRDHEPEDQWLRQTLDDVAIFQVLIRRVEVL